MFYHEAKITESIENLNLHKLADIREGLLKHATRLQISENLSEFPNEIYELAETLEILDLSDNQLSELPEDFACLRQLKVLFLQNNHFSGTPVVLADCQNLELVDFRHNQIVEIPEHSLPPSVRSLVLTKNKITKLPGSMRELKNLQKLMLADNQLTHLPDSLQQSRALQQISLSANQLASLPDFLFQLPKLAWLAFSGNPFCAAPVEIDLEHSGLLSGLKPDDFSKLGDPPTLQSCTRDHFDDDFMVTVAAAHKIAMSVVEVMLHLLAKGVCHGSLYAHNILTNADADILLSDFGSASNYASLSSVNAAAMQAIEVRAFGCLLEDLLGSSCDSDECEELFEPLVLLKNRCMHPKVSQRPTFADIKSELGAL